MGISSLLFQKEILLLVHWRVRLLLLHIRSKVRESSLSSPELDLIAAAAGV